MWKRNKMKQRLGINPSLLSWKSRFFVPFFLVVRHIFLHVSFSKRSRKNRSINEILKNSFKEKNCTENSTWCTYNNNWCFIQSYKIILTFVIYCSRRAQRAQRAQRAEIGSNRGRSKLNKTLTTTVMRNEKCTRLNNDVVVYVGDTSVSENWKIAISFVNAVAKARLIYFVKVMSCCLYSSELYACVCVRNENARYVFLCFSLPFLFSSLLKMMLDRVCVFYSREIKTPSHPVHSFAIVDSENTRAW